MELIRDQRQPRRTHIQKMLSQKNFLQTSYLVTFTDYAWSDFCEFRLYNSRTLEHVGHKELTPSWARFYLGGPGGKLAGFRCR